MDDQQKPFQDGSSQPQQPSVTQPQFTQPGAPAPGMPSAQGQQPTHLYYDTPQAGGMVAGNGKSGGKRKLFAIAGTAALLVLAGGGYVFGYYIPNKPENVFNAALSNTSKGYDQLVNYASDDEVAKKLKNTETEGSFKASGGGFSTDGTFKAHSDGKNADFSGDIGLAATRLTVDGLVKDVDSSNSPDLYVKVGGVKGLGSLIGTPAFDGLDEQWITIDHTLFDTYSQQLSAASGVESADPTKDLPKEADVIAAANVLGNVSEKYLFSTDEKTAVLKNDSFVGKETVDGKATNHYKVSADKEHLKAFTKELGTELDKTNLSKWTKENYKKSLSEVIDTKGMAESADKIKSSDKFDLWVNTKTKMLHKVRFANSKDADKNYYELGLNYDGGAEKPFFLNFASDKDGVTSTGTFGVTLNTDTNAVKFSIKGEEKGDNPVKIEVSATIKPTDKKVDTTVPEDAMSLTEVMQSLGLGDYMSALESQAQSLDDSFSEDLSQDLDTDTATDDTSVDPFTLTL